MARVRGGGDKSWGFDFGWLQGHLWGGGKAKVSLLVKPLELQDNFAPFSKVAKQKGHGEITRESLLRKNKGLKFDWWRFF